MGERAPDAGELCWLYTDGRHYDAKYTWLRKDIPFYIGQARKYGDPILELACGTGRITIPLAEKGLRVTGIDLAPEMLAEARKKAADRGLDISWVEADIRDFSLPRKYNLIIFPFNSIAHLTEPWDLEACFKRVRRHLSGRGRFIIQMFNPDLKILLRGPARRHVAARYQDPDGRGIVTITESNSYDRATQLNHLKWEFSLGRKRWTEDLDMRIYFPREMDALLAHNGFRIEHKYGDFDRSPFKSESPNHILVCRAK